MLHNKMVNDVGIIIGLNIKLLIIIDMIISSNSDTNKPKISSDVGGDGPITSTRITARHATA